MNLLQTIISSFINKNYYYIIILIRCYVFPLPLRILYAPCYVELPWILNYNVLKKISKIFQSILCRMNKWNFVLSTNVFSFDVLTILIHHFALCFSILSQEQKFYVKRKNNTQSSCMIFFTFYVGWTHFLRASLFMKVVSQ